MPNFIMRKSGLGHPQGKSTVRIAVIAQLSAHLALVEAGTFASSMSFRSVVTAVGIPAKEITCSDLMSIKIKRRSSGQFHVD